MTAAVPMMMPSTERNDRSLWSQRLQKDETAARCPRTTVAASWRSPSLIPISDRVPFSGSQGALLRPASAQAPSIESPPTRRIQRRHKRRRRPANLHSRCAHRSRCGRRHTDDACPRRCRFVRHHDDRLARVVKANQHLHDLIRRLQSRFPVGSSARITCGSLTSARNGDAAAGRRTVASADVLADRPGPPVPRAGCSVAVSSR